MFISNTHIHINQASCASQFILFTDKIDFRLISLYDLYILLSVANLYVRNVLSFSYNMFILREHHDACILIWYLFKLVSDIETTDNIVYVYIIIFYTV